MWTNLDVVEWACLIAWLILLLPVLAFLLTTWRSRRDDLFARLDRTSLQRYYKQFFPSRAKRKRRHEASGTEVRNGDIESLFKRDFGRLYGKRHYLLPFGLVALVSGIGMFLTAKSLQSLVGMSPPFKPFPAIALSAFLGAYAWVLYDQITRFRKSDFTPHDVYSYVYRFLIAIPLGISLSAILKDNAGISVAFLLGAFPTTTLMSIARRVASQKLGLGEDKKEGLLELEKLQSIGRLNAERYLDEGITTIAELAWADPIDLTIKTNRQFNFVVDSISQALLWVYFEDSVRKLYPLALRGAQEVCSFLDDLTSEDDDIRNAAEQTLKTAAGLLATNQESFLYTLYTVRDDPYTQFLYKIWN
jgi:hypothetical protein